MSRIKKLIFFIVPIAIIMVYGCSKDDERSVPVKCELNTCCEEHINSSINVEYTLEGIGDINLTEFYYVDADGEQIVTNPEYPYTIITTLSDAKDIKIMAKGIVRNGEIRISYYAEDNGIKYEGTDFCAKYLED